MPAEAIDVDAVVAGAVEEDGVVVVVVVLVVVAEGEDESQPEAHSIT